MALVQALTLLSALISQSSECELGEVGSRAWTPFVRIVNIYRRGQFEEAIRELGELDLEVVERMIRQQAPGMDDHCLEAASLVETELAMKLAERSRWDDADSHFKQAWEISFLIEAPPRRLRFQRDLLLAAGLHSHQLIFVNLVEEAFSWADRYLQNAVQRYPEDVEILLAAGALLEWAGSLRWGDSSHLKEAEELYSRALRFAPNEPEILLRHGQVLEKLGKDDEAAASLKRVLALDASKDLTYRGRMVLGRLAERAGRLPEAIAHYESASQTIPSWQVAYIALGYAFHASDSHERAREELDRALVMDMEEADEAFGGWWSYELGVALRFDPLLERMRAEVRQ